MPVLDLRQCLGLTAAEYIKETVVIVVRAADPAGSERSLGLVVDAVSDVFVARDDEVISTLDFGACVPSENIVGLINVLEQMVVLLDVASLLDTGPSARPRLG